MKLDFSATGWARVYALTALGTASCIGLAFVYDSFSFKTGTWQHGSDPINNVMLPLMIAPPFFFAMLYKLRQLAIAHHELFTLATTDSLTSLLNRRAFTGMVDAWLKRSAQPAAPSHGALLVIDVDHFKAINDRYGHDNGDEALKLIADTISANVRETDLVGRLGGEEFCVFVPAQSADRVKTLAERIRAAITETRFAPRGQRHALSVSVGGVVFDQGATFKDLYHEADKWLYYAKSMGRNRVELAALGTHVGEPASATAAVH